MLCCRVLTRVGLLMWLGAITSAKAQPVVADGRDPWTLLKSHPVNHQLELQLDSPDQGFRIGRRQGLLLALGDVDLGTQQKLANDPQTRFHGWFVLDSYWQIRAFDGLDLNVNLLLLNPSASDGYRASAMVHPGLGAHLYKDLFCLDGSPLTLHVLGIDLGWITTGNGLLLESTPLEGVVAAARFRDWELRALYGGRALYVDDDYKSLTLSALSGTAELNLVSWQRSDEESVDQALYTTMVSRWSILKDLHLASEFGMRFDKKPKTGILLRADALTRRHGWAFHLGYQFRYYQAGFGPRDRLITPTWPFNSLAQQDMYVTNPFLYHGISAAYDQWSHTVMGEARWQPFRGWEPYLDLEVLRRYARSQTVPKMVMYTADGGRAPGRATQAYFETGLRWYPWYGLPHRGSFAVTNHGLNVGETVTTPVEDRVKRGLYYLARVEAWL